jgi:hypothetical protein
MSFAMNSVPTGWLKADGSELSKTTYSRLFAALGITYGETNGLNGVGTTHFRVPDLRGIFVRGSGSQIISGVTYSATFGVKEGYATGPHKHSGTTGNDTDHTHQYAHLINDSTPGGIPLGGEFRFFERTSGIGTKHTHGFTTDDPVGASTDTRPANIALLYCIKF